MEKDVTILISEVLEREGGYVDHPADRGGPTNWGITQAVARAQGYAGEMGALPRATAESIYRTLYWSRPGYDRIAKVAPDVAAELFDAGINMGTGRATAFLQRALNALNRNGRDYSDLAVDHRIGAATLAALNAFLNTREKGGQAVLLRALNALQGAHYMRLAETRPSQEAFLYGWLANRVS